MHPRCVVSDSVNWFCTCSECRDMPSRSTLARLDAVAYGVGKLRSCIAKLKAIGSLDCPEAWCLLHLCCVVSDSVNLFCTCKQRRALRHPPTLTRLYAVANCVETQQLHGSAEVKAAGSQNDREACCLGCPTHSWNVALDSINLFGTCRHCRAWRQLSTLARLDSIADCRKTQKLYCLGEVCRKSERA